MYFLVDYENVNNGGLKGVENLSASDKVLCFYRENDTISFSTVKKLEKTKAQKDYILVNAKTKNAVDFQIVACLGSLCAKNPNEKFFIISNDGGYDVAIEYLCKNEGVTSILRCPRISVCQNGADYTTENEVKKLVPKYADKAAEIAEVIDKYKTRSAINNNLMKLFSSAEVGEIYKKIKPLLIGKN